MSTVPSVNETKPEVPDSESSDTQFVDPIFKEMNPDRLPDEPEPTPEEIEARQAEEAAAAQAERKAKGELSKKELAALLAEIPDDDEPPAEGSEGAEGEGKEGGDGDGAPGEGAEGDDKAAKKPDKTEDGDGKAGDDGEEGAEAGAEGDEGKGKRQRGRSHDRRQIRRMQRRIDMLEARLKDGGAPAQQQPDGQPGEAGTAPAAAPEQGEPQPKLDDYDDAGKWAEAFADWTRKEVQRGMERAKQVEEQKAREAERIAAEEAERKAWEAFIDREDDTREKYDDYDDLVYGEDTLIPQIILPLITESENGPEIAYWLAQNQEEAKRIAGLSEVAAAREIGRIEARISQQAAAQAPPSSTTSTPDPNEGSEGAEQAQGTANSPPAPAKQPPRRSPTKAPAPVPTVGGGGTAPSRDPSKMSMEEYREGRLSGKIR